jgi:hypothetical protein
VDAAANAPLFHLEQELIAIDRQLHEVKPENVEMPAMPPNFAIPGWLDLFQVTEVLTVQLRPAFPRCNESFQFS